MATGYRLPVNQSIDQTLNFLTWEQFPAILERSIRYFATLPATGIYRHVNSTIKPFKPALLEATGRDFTISGVGSFIDEDYYGHQIKRPTPQLAGTGCNGNSLCLEPRCFGFTEGVIESNNVIRNICWTLSMPCLKDYEYSDAQFANKIKRYFKMFFEQPPAVLEAVQRTRLIRDAIKIVATSKNIKYVGPVIGGTDGISLPFYINPVDATAFPNINNLGSGVTVGGINLDAFAKFIAPNLFTGAFVEGMAGLTIYGLASDYIIAKEQTASVQDHAMAMDLLRAMALRGGGSIGDDIVGNLLGSTFVEDKMFPTFKSEAGEITIVTKEVLEPSTIAGFVQTTNPEHSMQKYRGLLLVPDSYRFNLVEPPRDNFSDLGLGEGLNFRNNTPGVFPIMSSSMFTQNQLAEDGVMIIGEGLGQNGFLTKQVTGLRRRPEALREAIRTELMQTYTQPACNAAEGQLSNVGPLVTYQKPADGFALKSTMYYGTDVRGTAKPVLLLFQIDQPRSAKPIVPCSTVEVTIDTDAESEIMACCPGNQIYAVLTFRNSVSDQFAAEDNALYRTGANGDSYLVTITAISEDGKTVTIQSADEETILPCCTGSPDDYGNRAELTSLEDITNLTSEIMKANYDTDTGTLFVELFVPVAGGSLGATGTITLENGTVISVVLEANAAPGVFVQLDEAPGEENLLSELDCACLINAVFTLDDEGSV